MYFFATGLNKKHIAQICSSVATELTCLNTQVDGKC